LKLNCDDPLSNFAFNFNLRRYTKPVVVDMSDDEEEEEDDIAESDDESPPPKPAAKAHAAPVGT